MSYSFSHEPAAWSALATAIVSVVFGATNDNLTQGIVVAAVIAIGGVITRSAVRPVATSIPKPELLQE